MEVVEETMACVSSSSPSSLRAARRALWCAQKRAGVRPDSYTYTLSDIRIWEMIILTLIGAAYKRPPFVVVAGTLDVLALDAAALHHLRGRDEQQWDELFKYRGCLWEW